MFRSLITFFWYFFYSVKKVRDKRARPHSCSRHTRVYTIIIRLRGSFLSLSLSLAFRLCHFTLPLTGPSECHTRAIFIRVYYTHIYINTNMCVYSRCIFRTRKFVCHSDNLEGSVYLDFVPKFESMLSFISCFASINEKFSCVVFQLKSLKKYWISISDLFIFSSKFRLRSKKMYCQASISTAFSIKISLILILSFLHYFSLSILIAINRVILNEFCSSL